MFKLVFIVALVAVLLSAVACGDDDETRAKPLAVTDRLLVSSDLPGYSIVREFDWDDAEGVRDDGLGTTTIRASAEDAYSAVRDAGFKTGAARVFERNDTTQPADSVVVVVLELGSDAGARDVLSFSADDSEQPCPETCAFQVSKADIKGIPKARGVLRLATAESIAETGTTDIGPGEVHRITFTDGPFFYYISTANTPPSDEAADMAQALAKRLYERVKGSPAPTN